MINVTITRAQIMAWLGKDTKDARRKYMDLTLTAQKQAVLEWSKLSPGDRLGLAYRFTPEAFAGLGLTYRSKRYQTQQIKSPLGAATPYVAPYTSLSKSGKRVESGSMRQQVLNGGYNADGRASHGDAVTTYTVTGARILNQLGANGARYRDEFLNFGAGGRRDADWIANRTQELLLKWMQEDMHSATPTTETATAHVE